MSEDPKKLIEEWEDVRRFLSEHDPVVQMCNRAIDALKDLLCSSQKTDE